MSKTFKDKKKKNTEDNYHSTKVKHVKLNPFSKKQRKIRYDDE